jgi:hypothetical protein
MYCDVGDDVSDTGTQPSSDIKKSPALAWANLDTPLVTPRSVLATVGRSLI